MNNRLSHLLMNRWFRKQCSGLPAIVRRLHRTTASVAMLLLFQNTGTAQDFIVNGTVNNTGRIRVLKQTIIAQPNVGGEIELVGTDQTLPAKTYETIRLSGTGTKTTSGGDLSVLKNLFIASPVTLNITKGTTVTLGDTLFESGSLRGAIRKTVDLSGSTTSSDFGRIGATVSWSGATAPGVTTVTRVSDSLQFGNGNQSTKRYYHIQPADAAATGTITFKYGSEELNGHNVQHLQLWRSLDNGSTWIRYAPVVDTLLRTITQTNVPIDGRWTMADTIRAIGPLNGSAGVPRNLVNNSVPNVKPVILAALNPYQVRVTDIFNTPVQGVTVVFSITARPAPGAGGTLSNGSSVDSVVSDASGLASTIMTLGTKVGVYEVTASSVSLTSLTFKDTANHGPARSLASVFSSQMKPILSQLDSAFMVTVKDIGDNPVKDARVTFSLVNIPAQSFGESISDTVDFTDSLGRASTLLTLGSKTQQYTVRAKVDGVSDSVTFTASALVGAAASMNKTGGDNQSAVNGTPLPDPFVVNVLDQGGNPVPNDTVEFTIQSVPNFGAQLSATRVVTNSSGQASTILTLGTLRGQYQVSARSATLGSGAVLGFSSFATAGAASSIARLSGNGQSATILQPLTADFVVKLVDASGNGVPDSTITFRIDSLPMPEATGHALSVVSFTTDTSGVASTRLTLGNKAGRYVVSALSNGVPIVSFNSQASAGAASVFASTFGSNQTAKIISPLANPLAVRVADVGGNSVAGVPVTFAFDSVPSAAIGYQFSDTTVVTGEDGVANTIVTLGSKVGKYRITASAAGLSDSLFFATATQGAAAVFTERLGDGQVNPTGTMLDTAFTIRVQDIGGNFLVNSDVAFTFDSVPQFATGYVLRDTLVKTDSAGFATTVMTLGNREGTYVVSANVEGVLSTKFSTSAFYIYGDPNNDVDVNVADITTIIDQIVGNLAFTDVDSIKSDLNRDNKLDTMDIYLLRDYILNRPIFSDIIPPFTPDGKITGSGPRSAKVKSKFTGAKAQFETTPQGLRLNMENTVPVRGIEVRIRLVDSTASVDNINYLFSRAQNMSVDVRSSNNEVRMLAYSLINAEIEPGSGTILRIPKITTLDQIDTMDVILSIAGNTAVKPESVTVSAPTRSYPLTYRLSQNYPNPFNGSTTIQYEIPDDRTTGAKVAIQIFNILGQKVKTLLNAPQDPGIYTITWNGTDEQGKTVSSGVYFYRFITKTHVTTKKMIYVK